MYEIACQNVRNWIRVSSCINVAMNLRVIKFLTQTKLKLILCISISLCYHFSYYKGSWILHFIITIDYLIKLNTPSGMNI